MQRDLVDERRWIGREDYLQGLALSQLSPGPLAAQLAMYLGWVRGGTFGAGVIGVAFVAPSFLMVIAIAALYVRYGGLAWMQGVFYGVGAAVVAIIALSTKKLAAMALGKDPTHWVCFVVTALVTAWTESEMVWLFLAAGVVAMMLKAPPGAARARSSPSLRSSCRASMERRRSSALASSPGSSRRPVLSCSGAALQLSRSSTAGSSKASTGSTTGSSSTRWRSR
jgi:putative chromate ion transporter